MWLDQNSHIEQMTWAPGLPMFIEDQLLFEGGWIHRKSANVLNVYRAPRIALGDALPKLVRGWTMCGRFMVMLAIT